MSLPWLSLQNQKRNRNKEKLDLSKHWLWSNCSYWYLRSEDIQVELFRDKVKNRVVNETTLIARIEKEEVTEADFSTNAAATLLLACEIRKSIRFSTPVLNTMLLEFGLAQARRPLTSVLLYSALFNIERRYNFYPTMHSLGEETECSFLVVSNSWSYYSTDPSLWWMRPSMLNHHPLTRYIQYSPSSTEQVSNF